MANKFLKPTSAKEWRKLREEGIMCQLPSGFIAQIRPVPITSLYRTGKIPNILLPMIAELMTNGEVNAQRAATEAENSVQSLTQLFDIICVEAFIEPKVVMTVEELESNPDAICVDDISFEDKKDVLGVTQAPSAALIAFRKEQESYDESLRDVQDVLDPAVEAA